MRALAAPRSRPAFTLVELIVVISIIAILATLTVVYAVPAFQENKSVQRGVDRTSQTLLIARQRAFRDQLARGVRLIPDAANPAICRELQYIEQPDPFAEGTVQRIDANNLFFTLPGDVTLYGGADPGDVPNYRVQPGDFVDVTGLGARYIVAVTGLNTVQINTGYGTWTGARPYKIYRQPRPLVGEETVKLPTSVVIDLTRSNQGGFTLPMRNEILFSRSGSVQSQSGTPTLVLWVADETNLDNPTQATAQIVVIQSSTGFIASHPIATAADYYQFARDGRASGM